MHLAVTRAKYREDERVADYYRRIVDRVKIDSGRHRRGHRQPAAVERHRADRWSRV